MEKRRGVIVRPIVCRPFIGRRDDLEYLHQRRREAGSSRGGLVLISGDAGVGKTRLINEFRLSLGKSRMKIAIGQCLEFAQRPYGPLLDVLAHFDPAAARLEPAASKREQFDAVVGAFERVAARTAIIVVIEDLHWSDAATLELLTYFAGRIEPVRILLIGSYRREELHADDPALAAIAKLERGARAGHVVLAPLNGTDLRTFIDEALAEIALPDETRRAIALAGDGNPFFTEELLKSAVENGSARRGARSGRDLPPTVRATLLQRLRPLADDERRVVTQAAVIGRTFGLKLLARTLGTDETSVLPALRRARDFQLLEEVSPAVFRFRHGLTREAIYGDFLGAEVPPLHRTIALALEDTPGEPATEALAYHWWAAGDGQRSTLYNELAGDAAGLVHAHEDAIAFYERALEADGVDPARRGAIMRKVADRRHALTSLAEAAATYAAAADAFRDAHDYEREAMCRVEAALNAYILAQPAPTAPLEAMLERLRADEYLARSRVHLGLAWLAASFWFPTDAARHLAHVDSRALTAAPDIRLRFHNVSAWVAMTLGDIPRFRREHAAWADAARSTGSFHAIAAAHYNGAMCFSFFGLHEEALQNIEHALRVARDARSRHAVEASSTIAAMCYILCGDLVRARAAVDTVTPSTENRLNLSLAIAWGTVIGAYVGDDALTEKWFRSFEATEWPRLESECGAGLAEALVRRGRHRDAAALLHRVIPDCERIRGNVLTLLAAGRYGAPGDRARARAHLMRAAEGPDELVERPALALFDALACRREERHREAAALARDAAAGFNRLRIPLLEAEALEIAGEIDAARLIYVRTGALAAALRLDHDIGRPDMADASGKNAGAAKSQALSSREHEVARLVASGYSNIEIGRRLSISHKTVEKHLGSIYQKLGFSSRTQLAAVVSQETPA